MSEKFLLIAALAVFAVGLYAAGLKFQRDQLAGELEAMRRQAETLALELELNRRALAGREAEKSRLAEEKSALAAALEEVYANDQNARDWAAVICPGAVVDRLLR